MYLRCVELTSYQTALFLESTDKSVYFSLLKNKDKEVIWSALLENTCLESFK